MIAATFISSILHFYSIPIFLDLELKKLLPLRNTDFSFTQEEISRTYDNIPVSGAFNEELMVMCPSFDYANDYNNCNDYNDGMNGIIEGGGFIAHRDPGNLQGKMLNKIESQNLNDNNPKKDVSETVIIQDVNGSKRDRIGDVSDTRVDYNSEVNPSSSVGKRWMYTNKERVKWTEDDDNDEDKGELIYIYV